MEFLDKLLKHTNYLKQLSRLEQLEQDRIFCGHGLPHLLDVARIAWIKSLEQELGLEKEQIYLTALLHDLGRTAEYENGIPHHIAGIRAARGLLLEIKYPKGKSSAVLAAINGHREIRNHGEGPQARNLEEVIKWADKKSRNCFWCRGKESCKWPMESRNQGLSI